MVKMKVKVVGIDQNSMMPVVVITDAEEKGFIPILIGPAEAQAISIQMEGMKPPRPITHDLLKTMLDTLNTKVDRVVISDLKDETYFAKIYVKSRDGEMEVDARPSDAIALALRSDSPIYISEEVAAKALIANKPIDDDEMEAFRKFLEGLTPDDFERNLKG
ncbi:bifunctional nuclease family protein [Limnochorda pilosa]|uniref:BFN domain-containing protein n=1 Tax=Limnochorda pilosa TaxID=1555112 RepID=A0A0K2SPP3_LIMPI|nr:bifunctional nuclease family protein [Limnochorda pilosa]BAS28972.1 hypothetical protein LIP_3145 [Limnochorda pilosa]